MEMPTKEQVAAILRDAAEHVEQGDSFEGTISWSLIDESLDVRYRIGNREGQGGMRMMTVQPATAEDSSADRCIELADPGDDVA